MYVLICAANDIGYAFDKEKINRLIESCIKKDMVTSEGYIKDISERFVSVSPDRLKTLLTSKLPVKDGVIFAELSISEGSFKSFFNSAQFPWYIFDKRFRENNFK